MKALGKLSACDHEVVPVSLVFTSDTHVPQRARDLPHALWAAIEAADVVVHAGDWVDVALLDAFEARSRRLLAVHGNNDHGPLRERLSEVAQAAFEGVRIAVVHETGDRKGREERCAARFPGTDVLVFGHSHIPWDTTAPNGLRLINPGSPTDRRRQPHGTFVTAVAADGALRDVVFHAVPPRT
jgi:putative phosphoesterase